MKWSLKELYSSFKDESFLNDLTQIEQLAKEVDAWAVDNLGNTKEPGSKLLYFITTSEKAATLISKTIAFASLSNATDANDEEALYYLNKVRELANGFVKANVQFQMFLKEINDLETIIKNNDTLEVYRFYLLETKRKASYLLSEKEEILISKLIMSGSTAWSNLQNQITSTLMVEVEIQGEVKLMPFPAARNLAYSSDADTRKSGYEAELKAYPKIEESSAAALNGIKKEVITLSTLRGYESPLEETLIKSRMGNDTLDAMLVAMQEALPSFHKFYQHKAKLLGHAKGLPFYDLFAPSKETSTEYTYEEAMNYIIKQFTTFSRELGEFTQHAKDNNWLDVIPRPGKRGGAFCSNIHPIKESRVLSNFDGSFSNLTTLAHELGHAYHGHQLKQESILNSRYPMPLAETASIFCETIVVNAALKQASKDEKIAILESSISDAGQVIVDIYSRFIFESSLFEKRNEGVVSTKQLKELMINAQKKAYGDGLDHDVLHPYMWLNKPHYYSAGLNFYNFPYAFGLLFAKGLYAQYKSKPEGFVEKYNTLLQATGKNDIKHVASMVGVDVSSPDFFRQSLALVQRDIDQFIELTSESLK
jgi:pepF/M3 family oligoendopeptidase